MVIHLHKRVLEWKYESSDGSSSFFSFLLSLFLSLSLSFFLFRPANERTFFFSLRLSRSLERYDANDW